MTSLQAEITASMRPPEMAAPTAFQRTLHGGHWILRERLISSFWATFDPTIRRWATTINSCGVGARVYVDPDAGQVRPWMPLCHDRMCPFCGQGRVVKVSGQVAEQLHHMKAPKALTLTARDVDGPLKDRIKVFKKAFRKLRTTDLWKATVHSGIYAVETTRNPDTGRWHVHLHVIIDSDYLHWQQLLRTWGECIPGGCRLWIRQVTDRDIAARHLAKYICKPPAFASWPDYAIVEYARAVRGCRMIQPFGERRPKAIDDKPDKPEEPPNRYSVSIPRLVKLARKNFTEALDLCVLIKRRWAVFGPFIQHELPKLPDLAGFEKRTRVFRHRAPPAEDIPMLEAALFIAFTKFKTLDDQAHFPDSSGHWSTLPDPDDGDFQ